MQIYKKNLYLKINKMILADFRTFKCSTKSLFTQLITIAFTIFYHFETLKTSQPRNKNTKLKES